MRGFRGVTNPTITETIPKIDELITHMVADLYASYMMPGQFEAARLASYAAAIDSLTSARLRLPLNTFAP